MARRTAALENAFPARSPVRASARKRRKVRSRVAVPAVVGRCVLVALHRALAAGIVGAGRPRGGQRPGCWNDPCFRRTRDRPGRALPLYLVHAGGLSSDPRRERLRRSRSAVGWAPGRACDESQSDTTTVVLDQVLRLAFEQSRGRGHERSTRERAQSALAPRRARGKLSGHEHGEQRFAGGASALNRYCGARGGKSSRGWR